MELTYEEKQWLNQIPKCPKCSSKNGSLGTSGSYFICRDCNTEQYWTKDNKHPCDIGLDWTDGIGLSPYGHTDELYFGYLELKIKLTELQDEMEATKTITE